MKRRSLKRPYAIIRSQLKDKGEKINKGMKELILIHASLYNIKIDPYLPLGKSRRRKYAYDICDNNKGYVCKKKKRGKSHKKIYYEYLKSKEWASIRKSIIEDRKRCERCYAENDLQVHHKTYENVFNEKDEDLELLCRHCHQKEHGLIFNKSNYYESNRDY